MSIEVKPRTDIVIRGADGKPLAVAGVSKVWARDPLTTYWKKVKVVVTREDNWTLISLRDQKRLLLLESNYPRFLGTGKYRRSTPGSSPRKRPNRDSGISQSGSDSESESEEDTDIAHVTGSTEGLNGPLLADMVEVRVTGDSIEVELRANITEEDTIQEAYADVFCNEFGQHFAREWLGEEGLAALINTPTQGKPDDDGDDDPDSPNVGPDMDEDELIAQKTEFERNFILKFRSLFSESLSPDHYI